MPNSVSHVHTPGILSQTDLSILRVLSDAKGRVVRRADREQNGVPLAQSLIKQVDEMAKTLSIAPLTGRGSR